MNIETIQTESGTLNHPRTLFKPGSWLAKIDFINHLILFNNVLITVLSEKEGGKTSFASLLQSNLDQQIKPISMLANAPCDRQNLINDLATQLHLNNDAQTNIESIVTQINERKAHILLIIDNAQHLPESLIKEIMLALKSQGDFGFFHVCLVSDYSVVATLNNLAGEPFNNLIHTIELGALNEAETRTYVLQRAMATRLINKPLPEEQLKQFFQLTKGNLAKINLSLESFLFKCANHKKSNKAAILKKTSMVISLAALAGASYLYFNGFIEVTTSPKMTQLTTLAPIKAIVSEMRNESIQAPLVSEIASWQDSATRQLVHYALPKIQVLDELDENEEQINTVAIVDKVLVIPKIVAKNSDTETPLDAVNTALAAAVEQSRQVHIQAAEIKKAGKSEIAKAPVTKQTGKGHYTIQLVASHNIEDVNRFRNNNKLVAQTQIRHFTNAKGSWYILTLGEFESRNTAQVKTKALPAELAKLNPWIRSVNGLSSVG